MAAMSTWMTLLLISSIVAANLPWLSERFFFIFTPPNAHKAIWMRLLEWFCLFILFLIGALGIEKKLMGGNYQQGWEFYVVLFCLFLVFALPGFLYRHDLQPHLIKRQRRSK